jgi:uncharacterized protein YjcR
MNSFDENGEPREAARQDRLDSWKEIAEYLGKGVSTVRRWEREEGLPVHRQRHAQRGSIVAYKGELENWRLSRMEEKVGPQKERESLRRHWIWAAAGSVAAAVAAFLLWNQWT